MFGQPRGRVTRSANLRDAAGLDTDGADALVLSSCVQMPSLESIQAAEDWFGLPVSSAATATTYELLDRLGLSTHVSRADRLFAGGLDDRPPGPRRRTTEESAACPIDAETPIHLI